MFEGIILLAVNVGRTQDDASGTEGCKILSYSTNAGAVGAHNPPAPYPAGGVSQREGEQLLDGERSTSHVTQGLAPTLEVFELRVSKRRQTVGPCVFDNQDGDGVWVNQRRG